MSFKIAITIWRFYIWFWWHIPRLDFLRKNPKYIFIDLLPFFRIDRKPLRDEFNNELLSWSGAFGILGAGIYFGINLPCDKRHGIEIYIGR